MARKRPFQNPYLNRHLPHKNIVPPDKVKKIEKPLVEDVKSPWLRRVLRRLGKK